MPNPKRDAFGRYDKASKSCNHATLSWFINFFLSPKTLILVIIVIFCLSPWVYLIIIKRVIDSTSQKVSDFFETSFSCACPNGTDKDTTRPTQKNGF